MLSDDLGGYSCPNASCSQCGVKGAGNLYRQGTTARGVPRFRCVTCGKTFSSTTGTALHRLRHAKERIVEAAGQVLYGGASYREAARDNQVSHPSVRRWVQAFRSHPDLLAAMEQERRDALPVEVKALLAHGVEVGLISASKAAATELEILRGDRSTYRVLVAQLMERHGTFRNLLRAILPDQA